MRGRQLSFLPPPRLSHGGDIRRGKRKLARPLDPKRPMHVTLRALQATGEWSMLRRGTKGRVFLLAHQTAEKYGVRIYRFENVGNHLHLLVLAPSRRAFQAFLRVLTAAIAFLVTGTKKGQKLARRFWDKLAYSRIIDWGREFRALETYFAKNLLESLGIPREDYLLKPLPRGPDR
jgi:REP element-mobilizing transposase RayT